MAENSNKPTTPPKNISELYPTAYKGALKADPLVDMKPKKPFWKFWRASDNTFRALYLVIAAAFILFIVSMVLVVRAS